MFTKLRILAKQIHTPTNRICTKFDQIRKCTKSKSQQLQISKFAQLQKLHI
jgi:hypothetical protein